MKEIKLGGTKHTGMVALVDDEDYEMLAAYGSWHTLTMRKGAITYASCGKGPAGKQKSIYMHRLLLPETSVIDHIDRNGLNNQRSNLRSATTSQNQGNTAKRAGCSSRFKGVCLVGGMWRAQISGLSKKTKYLGTFEDEEDAARAYDKAAREHFGEFAWLNFP